MNLDAQKDLIVLVADRNQRAAIEGILGRYPSLGIREVNADIFTHPRRDPGCRVEGIDYLRVFSRRYKRALLLFDCEGCGDPKIAIELENELEVELAHSGWDHRCSVVVIEPELEAWVWIDSPHVARELGWNDSDAEFRRWLIDNGWLQDGQSKPAKPKEAVEAVLASVRKPRSSAIYRNLADKVSLQRCTDRAFLKLKQFLCGSFASPSDEFELTP